MTERPGLYLMVFLILLSQCTSREPPTTKEIANACLAPAPAAHK